MRFKGVKLFITSLLIFFFLGSYAQYQAGKSCHTNVELAVVIDTLYQHFDPAIKKDSSRTGFFVGYAAFCNPCYVLRPLNEKYKVVSFKIISESNEDITEKIFRGDTITIKSGLVDITKARQGSTILFDCIQARHENGQIYVLRNLSIRNEILFKCTFFFS
jgi:hypothetical protein